MVYTHISPIVVIYRIAGKNVGQMTQKGTQCPTYTDNIINVVVDDDVNNTVTAQQMSINVDKYVLNDYMVVCDEGKRSISIENAGGKSDISEMYSIDYFNQKYGATGFILEKEVDYWINYKMVDFICTINGEKVGVSVTRAMGYPTSDKFTKDSAYALLHKKIYGLIVARDSVNDPQSFYKSILHIWCQSENIASHLIDAFKDVQNTDFGMDIIGVLSLQLTVCADDQLYKNYVKGLSQCPKK